MMHTCVYRV